VFCNTIFYEISSCHKIPFFKGSSSSKGSIDATKLMRNSDFLGSFFRILLVNYMYLSVHLLPISNADTDIRNYMPDFFETL
jgi:hypothetical protein